MRGQAVSRQDKVLAAMCWLGWFFGGPLVPATILVFTWNDTSSLARRHAARATLMWGVVMVVYLPMVARLMIMGSPDTAFFVVFGLVVGVVLVMTVVGLIQVARATTGPANPPPSWPVPGSAAG